MERNWQAGSWSRSILFAVMSKPRTTTKESTSLAFSCAALLMALVDELWLWSWIGSKCVGGSQSPVQFAGKDLPTLQVANVWPGSPKRHFPHTFERLILPAYDGRVRLQNSALNRHLQE